MVDYVNFRWTCHVVPSTALEGDSSQGAGGETGGEWGADGLGLLMSHLRSWNHQQNIMP